MANGTDRTGSDAEALVAPLRRPGARHAAGWVSLGPGNISGPDPVDHRGPEEHEDALADNVGGGVWRTDDGGKGSGSVDDFIVQSQPSRQW